MKVYLIAPKNPESFWTFDRVLPSLGKRCVFPNLALPTVAALTPPSHEVVLCDENDDSDLKVNEINVETFKGMVQLSGFVPSQADMDKAVQVARGVAGVKSVKADMRLK